MLYQSQAPSQVKTFLSHLQPLGEIRHFKSSSLVELCEVYQKLMRHPSIPVLESQTIVAGESVCHVVGVEQGDLGRFGQALAAKHLDVCPRYQEDGRAAKWCRRNGVDSLLTPYSHDRVTGEERRKVFSDTDWPENTRQGKVIARNGGAYPTPGPPPP
jgi:hypothetical protein